MCLTHTYLSYSLDIALMSASFPHSEFLQPIIYFYSSYMHYPAQKQHKKEEQGALKISTTLRTQTQGDTVNTHIDNIHNK